MRRRVLLLHCHWNCPDRRREIERNETCTISGHVKRGNQPFAVIPPSKSSFNIYDLFRFNTPRKRDSRFIFRFWRTSVVMKFNAIFISTLTLTMKKEVMPTQNTFAFGMKHVSEVAVELKRVGFFPAAAVITWITYALPVELCQDYNKALSSFGPTPSVIAGWWSRPYSSGRSFRNTLRDTNEDRMNRTIYFAHSTWYFVQSNKSCFRWDCAFKYKKNSNFTQIIRSMILLCTKGLTN